MNKKQSLYFNIIFPIYISIVLGFIMTAILVGFNEYFVSEFIKSLIVGIIMTTPPGFLVVGNIAQATLKSDPPTSGEKVGFHFYLALLMTFLVTIVSTFLAIGFPSITAFLLAWVHAWGIALLFAWVIIHFTLPKIQAFIINTV